MIAADAPRFSVLLPTHQRADVIGHAIASVLAQSTPDFELLVVGDGCTDGTAEVVASFADPRIRWFDLPKAPAFGYANRNIALREARGDLVAFMAHDDLYLPDHLEQMARPFDDPRVDWAYSRPVWVSPDGVVIPFAVDLRKPDQMHAFMTRGNTIPASCVVHRRSCGTRVGEWPEDVPSAGDWEYWKRIIRATGSHGIAYVEAATALHFRAAWRTDGVWGPPPLDSWLAVAAGPSWPASLRVPVPPGGSEQSVFLERSQADPAGWPARLRQGVAEAIDLLAWTSASVLGDLRAEAGSLHVRLAALEGDRASLTEECVAQEAAAEVLRCRVSEVTQERDVTGTLAEALRQRVADLEQERAAWTTDADALRRRVSDLERDRADLRVMAEEQSALRSALQETREALRESEMTARHYPGRLRRAVARIHRAPTIRTVSGWVPNPLFDADWYRERYPDVPRTSLGAWRHWRRHGWREGRDPSPAFSTAWYLDRYPDVRAHRLDPLEHYLLWGAAERRQRTPPDRPQASGSAPR